MKSVGIQTPTDLSLSILQLPTYRKIDPRNLKTFFLIFFLSLSLLYFYTYINQNIETMSKNSQTIETIVDKMIAKM